MIWRSIFVGQCVPGDTVQFQSSLLHSLQQDKNFLLRAGLDICPINRIRRVSASGRTERSIGTWQVLSDDAISSRLIVYLSRRWRMAPARPAAVPRIDNLLLSLVIRVNDDRLGAFEKCNFHWSNGRTDGPEQRLMSLVALAHITSLPGSVACILTVDISCVCAICHSVCACRGAK